jgi:predicted glycogen debranching enzyme
MNTMSELLSSMHTTLDTHPPWLDFGREITSNPQGATQREWLVTNGIGGYASGTVAGLLTRRYHGLLVAALQPPAGRTLLLARLDETATYDATAYPLFANQWRHRDAPLDPAGFVHLARFHLEGTTPVWTYALGDARLEKRIWMQQGANTTYIRYDFVHGSLPLHLAIKALVNYRDFHGNTHAGDWRMSIELVERGLRVAAYAGATPLYLLSDRAEAMYAHDWYRNYFLAVEAARGLDPTEDHLHVGQFTITLHPGESLTLAATTEAATSLDGVAAYAARHAYEGQLIAQANKPDDPAWVKQLVLAADQFVVRRAVENDPDGRSIIAGYHWFGDWGRDTMISLPGLTLVTGRHAEAAKILRTFASFANQGMLPNRFPDQGETPEYNTVDATLWYFNAIAAYLQATGDEQLLRDLFPVLAEIIDWHRRGTRYNIQVDPNDGLLYAGEPGVQLTWMDAKVGDWVVTPRTGKAVEINALWYNALRLMADFAGRLNEPGQEYTELANQVDTSFQRFWHGEAGYCYDVLDTPAGVHDAALRPNQLLAVSLPHTPLAAAQQHAVVDVCSHRLLTTLGLRSLNTRHPAYRGAYGGSPHERDAAYHQGTAWGWLVGPYLTAHWRVYHDKAWVQTVLHAFAHHLADYGVGSISELAHGDPPHQPDGCIAQAWSVAEVLRVWDLMQTDA